MVRPSVGGVRGLTEGHRGRVVAIVVLSVVQAILLLPVPLLLGTAFDSAIPDGDRGGVVVLALAIAATVSASGVVQVVGMNLQIGLATRIGTDLRAAMYRRVFAAPREMFDGTLTATVHDRVVNDSQRTIEMSGAALNKLVPDVVIAVGVSVILVVLEWRLALVTLAFVPVLLLVGRSMVRRQYPATRRYHGLFAEFSGRVMRVLRSQDLIRIAGAESAELAAADAETDELRAAHHRFELVAAGHQAIQQTVVGLAAAALLVAGGILVIDTRMSLGELLAFYAAFAMLRGPAGRTAAAYGELVGGWEAYRRALEFLADPREEPYRGTDDPAELDVLGLDAVTFGYDADRPVVRDLSLTVRSGAVTALVGPNGSGKSTVVNLLLGFYRPDRGTVTANGRPYDEIDLHELRAGLGVVRQDPHLLAGTVRDNITYGAPEPVDDDVVDRALRLSGAAEVIDLLPAGLDTVVGEDGHLLSGGQRQLIAIARALVRRPRTLILDEPTNHLDERAITELLDRLSELRRELGVLVISHQRRVISQLADEIVDLDPDVSPTSGRRGRTA